MQDLGPDDDDGQITWKQQLCLSHVRLRSTSVAVLEVSRKVAEGSAAQQGQSSTSGVEAIAWAFTKIMQVTPKPVVISHSGLTCEWLKWECLCDQLEWQCL